MQSIVALSTSKAEYIAASDAAREVYYMREVASFIRNPQPGPTVLGIAAVMYPGRAFTALVQQATGMYSPMLAAAGLGALYYAGAKHLGNVDLASQLGTLYFFKGRDLNLERLGEAQVAAQAVALDSSPSSSVSFADAPALSIFRTRRVCPFSQLCARVQGIGGRVGSLDFYNGVIKGKGMRW
ncbi:hypothetical protein T492DRAFT_889163 [Pavlovales sp. CCMP2436]|nr:hypothetical protein T492DRAFT_889163 [Pavlovales sp. CCMP2436]